MTPEERAPHQGGIEALVALYPDALPQVYGYLVVRCGSVGVAEDLTSETFLAAAAAVEERQVPGLTVAWLILRLVDHPPSTGV